MTEEEYTGEYKRLMAKQREMRDQIATLPEGQEKDVLDEQMKILVREIRNIEAMWGIGT